MIGLVPFVMVFIILLNFFVVMYSVLDTEITEELLTPGAMDSLGYYGMMNLAVLRNSVGKLNYPAYGRLAKEYKKDPSLNIFMQIETIWLMYVFQILFQLVIGLNFMIAIIEGTYGRVQEDKDAFVYSNKAELTHHVYTILKNFKSLDEYRVLMISSFKKNDDDTSCEDEIE